MSNVDGTPGASPKTRWAEAQDEIQEIGAVIAALVKAVDRGDNEGAARILNDDQEGRKDPVLRMYQVAMAMYLCVISASGIEPGTLYDNIVWRDPDWDGSEALKAMDRAMADMRPQEAFCIWHELNGQQMGGIMLELAGMNCHLYESATGHTVNRRCVSDPPCHPGGEIPVAEMNEVTVMVPQPSLN